MKNVTYYVFNALLSLHCLRPCVPCFQYRIDTLGRPATIHPETVNSKTEKNTNKKKTSLNPLKSSNKTSSPLKSPSKTSSPAKSPIKFSNPLKFTYKLSSPLKSPCKLPSPKTEKCPKKGDVEDNQSCPSTPSLLRRLLNSPKLKRTRCSTRDRGTVTEGGSVFRSVISHRSSSCRLPNRPQGHLDLDSPPHSPTPRKLVPRSPCSVDPTFTGLLAQCSGADRQTLDASHVIHVLTGNTGRRAAHIPGKLTTEDMASKAFRESRNKGNTCYILLTVCLTHTNR